MSVRRLNWDGPWNLGGIPGWIRCQSELETKGVRSQVQAAKPILIVQPPASQYARSVEDGGPAANVLEDLLPVVRHPPLGVQVVCVDVAGVSV